MKTLALVHKLAIAKCVLVAIALAVCGQASCQAIYGVNSTADMVDDNPGNGVCHAANGQCTLRAAIMEANRSDVGSIIEMQPGIYDLQIPPAAAYSDATGALKLTSPTSGNPGITILGAGEARTVIDANHLDRVLAVDSLRRAMIVSLTIRGGNSPDVGGGIANAGDLTLRKIDVSSNQSQSTGGGIFNSGTLTIDFPSSITNNSTPNNGGGIYNTNTGILAISTSTIAFNSGFAGGGIHSAGSLDIVNSTIAQNQAAIRGGGLFLKQGASAHALIHSSTIAYNGAYTQDPGDGGGIYILSGSTVTLRNSLLAGNRYFGDQGSFEDCYTDGSGILNTFGGNMLSTLTGCNTSNGAPLLNSLDDLGDLKNNGGPTRTIALRAGSNAIDAGNVCFDTDGNTLLTDQRGFARLVGSHCDAGAYEFDPDRIFTNGFE